MPTVVNSATLAGIDGVRVRVEVDVSGGLPCFHTVGLAEAAVRESRARVHAAIENSGREFPAGRVTVNLAPADLKKSGSGLDLPIALGVLTAADNELPRARLRETLVLGELSLSGRVRPVRGVLAGALSAAAAGHRAVLVPEENGAEAALAPGIEAFTVRSLDEAVGWLKGATLPRARPSRTPECANAPDLADVRGQAFARRALEVCAAGGHHLLFIGGPGGGKTMLARRLPSILPPLDDQASLEVTRVYSASGCLSAPGLVRAPPFRAPHHSTTVAGLVGGGRPPRAGELSLAHQGVLFLDELPEFSRAALEALRQPLESGEVILSRAREHLRFPARVQLVAAMNPCPCGHANEPARCVCSPSSIARYRARTSGPLLDRIDLVVPVAPIAKDALGPRGDASRDVAERVARARAFSGRINARITDAQLDEVAPLTKGARALLEKACDRLKLSARALVRTRRVARTIADLEEVGIIDGHHVAEALQYRR